jgi:hypothetical protein
MAIRGVRKIEADVIRHQGNAAMEAGIVVKMALGVAADGDSLLIPCDACTSGDSKTLGILLDKVIARPAEAEDSTDSKLKGIISDWVFTAAQPLFQEEGLRFVNEEVAIMRRGLITTNRIETASTPSGGMLAYAGAAGDLSARNDVLGSGTPIGVWQSAKDSDGYAQLYVNISAVTNPQTIT